MKTAAHRLVFVALSVLTALAGCSKQEVPAPPAGGDGLQSVMKGYAAFGSQCASGFNTDPKAVKLELWSCPVNLPVVELAEPIQPLYFTADCAHKVLTVRSQDKSINENWELMPDGSFNFTQNGLQARFKNDGAGNTGCVTSLSMDIWGQVDCSAPGSDQAKIRFETVMWLNKGTAPAAPPQAQPQCALPAGKCYFHAVSSVNQCS